MSKPAMRFTVSIASLTRWNKTIIPKATRENRPRKVDLKALAKDVETNPDAYQYERTLRFGIHPKSIWNGLRKLNCDIYKKPLNTLLIGNDRLDETRKYLATRRTPHVIS